MIEPFWPPWPFPLRYFRRKSLGIDFLFLRKRISEGNYGKVIRISRLSSIDKFIKKYLLSYPGSVDSGPDGRPYLGISSSIEGKHIPMLDVDSQDVCMITRLWLEENKMKYIVVESSEGHFWVFLDALSSSFHKALKIAAAVPGVDVRFLEASREQRCFIVRGHLKDNKFMPTVLHSNTDNARLILFCKNLEEHFKDSKVDWIRRYILYKEGAIEIADPQYGTPQTNTIHQWI